MAMGGSGGVGSGGVGEEEADRSAAGVGWRRKLLLHLRQRRFVFVALRVSLGKHGRPSSLVKGESGEGLRPSARAEPPSLSDKHQSLTQVVRRVYVLLCTSDSDSRRL